MSLSTHTSIAYPVLPATVREVAVLCDTARVSRATGLPENVKACTGYSPLRLSSVDDFRLSR